MLQFCHNGLTGLDCDLAGPGGVSWQGHGDAKSARLQLHNSWGVADRHAAERDKRARGTRSKRHVQESVSWCGGRRYRRWNCYVCLLLQHGVNRHLSACGDRHRPLPPAEPRPGYFHLVFARAGSRMTDGVLPRYLPSTVMSAPSGADLTETGEVSGPAGVEDASCAGTSPAG